MRLHEITAPTLFLCTRTPQQVGSVVKMDEPRDLARDDVETAIEAQRPDEHLSRAKSLTLALSPLGSNYTYVVEPIGRLERQSLGWLRKLRDADPTHCGLLAHYANGYWSGQTCPEARDEAWEYRASAVKIVSRFGGAPNT